MKKLIIYISAAFFCLITFSCSNSFLWQDPAQPAIISPDEVLISSDGATRDYSVYMPGVGNANFTVVNTPYWLNVETQSGQFIDDYATISCRVYPQSAFSQSGIYKSLMILNIEGIGKAQVTVGYVSGKLLD